MFKKVDQKQSFPKMEEEILKFWEENKVFEKSVEKNRDKKPFIFYEGPPTANGKPGLHHVLARSFKDIIPRYKTMKGFLVERKAGWDTHGLPVEIQVEKAHGIKHKHDILNIVPGDPRQSVIEFNKKCKESVWEYKDLWEKMTRRMGYWVDMKNPYVTYENKYIESVWWVLAQISKLKTDKGEDVLYKGHKVVPYCYRCGTALASHEVAQGYQTVKDNSAYIKFKLKEGQNKGYEIKENTYLIAWTTTPWTLPGNVALAVNPNVTYVIVYDDETKEHYIVADIVAEKLFNLADEKRYIRSYVSGAKNFLLDLEYEPLYQTNDTDKKTHYVVAGGFVTTDDGTGIVHIAPAFGADDADVAQENDLPTLITVDEEGKVSADVPGKGIEVKKKNDKNRYAVDDLIVEDLKQRGLFFKEEVYEHEYPFCWRCDTPLIYYAKPSWFIRMSTFSDELVKNNEEINWTPEYIKEGRFGEWLRGIKDWAISRDRYWGTPLPIWACSGQRTTNNEQRTTGCGNTVVAESINEIEKLSGTKLEDVHKPYIDDVKFKCEKCGGEMTRTPEVMDVWFDSGSMPLAQFHYPNGATEEDKKKIESGLVFPADYISEAIDQTRGWFYTLHAISTLLNKAGKVPTGNAYRNVICLAHILDKHGKKMSKSRGNVVEPMEVMDQYGADMLRWMLFTINQPGMPKKFDIKGMQDIMNRVFRMLWNSYSFFVMYAGIDGWNPPKTSNLKPKTSKLLDKWILSELNVLVKNVDEKIGTYDIYAAAKSIEAYIDNLSNWYIRRSRKRFWKSENDTDKNEAYATLHHVLVTLSQLMAPFTPFIAEEIYRNLAGCHSELVEESDLKSNADFSTPLRSAQDDKCISVHLADFPVADEDMIDEKLNGQMNAAREIVSVGLQKRAEAKIKVRQPLASATVFVELSEELKEIVKEELNVKEIIKGEMEEKGMKGGEEIEEKGGQGDVVLDTEITEELKLEGQAREVIRFIQEMRKAAGYEVDNRIILCYNGLSEVFEKFGDLIAKETLSEAIKSEISDDCDLKKDFEVDGEKIGIAIKKVV